jgi:cyclopropane fatty-acyl-phospholipid synthase-like methyltransferase
MLLGVTVSYYAAPSLPTPMSPALDPISLQFVIWAQDAGATVLDIGCGDGTTTLAVLARGGHVVAVDPDAAALHSLVERAPTEQCRRLRVRLGALPDIDFKAADFSAIHAARVLHLLHPAAVEQSLRKCYRWLYPEGRLFLSAAHPMNEEILRREVSSAGFFVEDVSTYLPPWEGSQECFGVIARCHW